MATNILYFSFFRRQKKSFYHDCRNIQLKGKTSRRRRRRRKKKREKKGKKRKKRKENPNYTFVFASFSSFGHPTQIEHKVNRTSTVYWWSLRLFATCVNVRAELWIRLATHLKSVRKYWFFKFALNCESVWPGLNASGSTFENLADQTIRKGQALQKKVPKPI